ncbi:helix-turn-helix domain-containing protein [Paenibacillus sp. FSL H8-0034]|uniref:helix-turn-helix domain-containing protein n=1 Tax=Paenibacillus sp. FSL H8-0034 TaxID=2954671 RepID=UPI0030FB3E4A
MIGLEYACKVFKQEQKELADKLKISASNVSGWLKGTREIPTKYLSSLSKIFNGLHSDYFQKELSYVDQLKVRIYYIESMPEEERYGRLERDRDTVDEEDDSLILDEVFDNYEDEIFNLYRELNRLERTNSYNERINSIFKLLELMTESQKDDVFNGKNPEDFIKGNLNNYIDFLSKFRIKDIAAIDLMINYFMDYKRMDQSKWGEHDVIPNEKQLAFYRDLEGLLKKHNLFY